MIHHFRDQEDIKAELRRRGHNSISLGKAHGVAPSVIRMAFISPSRKGEIIIAKALRMKPWEVWPDRWNPDGSRINKRHMHASKASALMHRQNVAAA
ncbi:helix-turn-helix domain-containing protein [Caulobacter henricii]|uniref:Ner winged helix-turn-helix DNA-binding domain-containing protein n=1 Tax=Caulobacter henricii TaxID=69395 RepID=A0A0P0P1Y3_9CAUL|nr:helix-turn-helix domain-containing protein [Caulobacter henricii]ALL14297.1 hypothetical protein AQ619_13605 [Caulobacter henricii]